MVMVTVKMATNDDDSDGDDDSAFDLSVYFDLARAMMVLIQVTTMKVLTSAKNQ